MKYKEQKQKLPRTWQENMDWKSKYFETKWKEQYEMSIARNLPRVGFECVMESFADARTKIHWFPCLLSRLLFSSLLLKNVNALTSWEFNVVLVTEATNLLPLLPFPLLLIFSRHQNKIQFNPIKKVMMSQILECYKLFSLWIMVNQEAIFLA
jgi:hypothetical protein